MKSDWKYGGKKTAINGIWNWLQMRNFYTGKITDESYNKMIQIVKDFLFYKGIPVSHVDIQNAQKVQSRFAEFKKWYESLTPIRDKEKENERKL